MDHVETEVSLLLLATQNIMTIFEDDEERIVEAGQCIADHVRVLVRESRGTELMSIIYSDPFIRMLNLLSEKKKEKISDSTSDVRKNVINVCVCFFNNHVYDLCHVFEFDNFILLFLFFYL